MRKAAMFAVDDLVTYMGERWNVTSKWGGSDTALVLLRYDENDSPVEETVEAIKAELCDRPEWERRVERGRA